ncbi:hypothetical protein D3C83_330380 [compost metagenome]
MVALTPISARSATIRSTAMPTFGASSAGTPRVSDNPPAFSMAAFAAAVSSGKTIGFSGLSMTTW